MPRTPRRRRTTQPVRGGLKGFADAKKPAVDLLRDVQTHVVAQGVKNAGVGREAHKIHVSEVVKDTACPRHMYYKLTKAEQTDSTGPAYHQLEMIWAAGHAEHDKWQRWLKEMGDLWGTWHCLQCMHIWEAIAPDACEKCGGTLLEYKEVNLEESEYCLVGHADGAVPRLNALVEVKSFSVGTVRIEAPALVKEHTHKVDGKTIIDHEGLWNAVKRPLKSHLVQGMFYLWMCDVSGRPELVRYDRIIFIYENKTTQKTKTFEIKFNVRLLKQFFAMLDEVQVHVEQGVAPMRPPLFDKGSKPCKDCVFRTKCWETDDDGTEASAVPDAGQGAGGEETRGAAKVRPPSATRVPDPSRARRRDRSRGPGTREPDGEVHQVGRAPRDATRDGRGRRAVGRAGAGQGEGTRFPRKRQGRH